MAPKPRKAAQIYCKEPVSYQPEKNDRAQEPGRFKTWGVDTRLQLPSIPRFLPLARLHPSPLSPLPDFSIDFAASTAQQAPQMVL